MRRGSSSLLLFTFCGNSSVGRAQPCQGWGREFESRFPLIFKGYPFGIAFFVLVITTDRYALPTLLLIIQSRRTNVHIFYYTCKDTRIEYLNTYIQSSLPHLIWHTFYPFSFIYLFFASTDYIFDLKTRHISKEVCIFGVQTSKNRTDTSHLKTI